MRCSLILVLLFIINSLLITSNAITFDTTEMKNLNQQFVESMLSSPQQEEIKYEEKAGSSPIYRSTTINEQTYLNYQPNLFPISINKYISSGNIDRYYKNNTICVVVQCSNIGDKPLDNINIYETVSQNGMSIVNCSLPIKASSIDEIIRHERNGANFFCARDILYGDGLVEEINRDEPIATYLDKSNIAATDSNTKNLSRILNNIINNIDLSSTDNYGQLFGANSPSPSKLTRTLLKQRRNGMLQECDCGLLNFLLLRDKYSKYLGVWGNIDILEPAIDENTGLINIPVSEILPKETIIFKYYVNLSRYGNHKATTTIRVSGDQYPDSRSHLIISFPAPSFDVKVVLPDLEVDPSDIVCVDYVVELLAPINESETYEFVAHIGTNSNNNDFSIINNISELVFVFGNEKTAYNSTNITFSKPGTHNIPVLIIGDNKYLVEDKYIKVEELWSKHILVLTLMFLGLFTLIGPNVRYVDKSMRYRTLSLLLTIGVIASALKLVEISSDYIGVILLLGVLIYVYWRRAHFSFMSKNSNLRPNFDNIFNIMLLCIAASLLTYILFT